jgi:hypothetical protein
MEARARILLAATLILLVGLVAAPAALAAPLSPKVKASVRVESSVFPVAGPTSVIFDWTKPFYDGAGNPYRRGLSALGALAAASRAKGFTWEAAYGGNFITQIGGFSSLADFSQGWIYAVNGAGYPIVDVGALDFQLEQNDAVLFAQYPDGTYAHGTKALVVRLAENDRAYETGGDVTITVFGDDLAKANSAADAERFNVDSSAVETSAQFAPVDAWVHVGSALLHADLTGSVTVTGLAPGTYRVWADHEMDSSFAYVRSAPKLINVADPLSLAGLTASPTPFRPGETVRFTFTASRAAAVKYTVRAKSGAVIASLTRRVAGGSVTLRWSGENAAGRPVRPGTYGVRITAVDTWGRTAPPLTTSIVAK